MLVDARKAKPIRHTAPQNVLLVWTDHQAIAHRSSYYGRVEQAHIVETICAIGLVHFQFKQLGHCVVVVVCAHKLVCMPADQGVERQPMPSVLFVGLAQHHTWLVLRTIQTVNLANQLVEKQANHVQPQNARHDLAKLDQLLHAGPVQRQARHHWAVKHLFGYLHVESGLVRRTQLGHVSTTLCNLLHALIQAQVVRTGQQYVQARNTVVESCLLDSMLLVVDVVLEQVGRLLYNARQAYQLGQIVCGFLVSLSSRISLSSWVSLSSLVKQCF